MRTRITKEYFWTILGRIGRFESVRFKFGHAEHLGPGAEQAEVNKLLVAAGTMFDEEDVQDVDRGTMMAAPGLTTLSSLAVHRPQG